MTRTILFLTFFLCTVSFLCTISLFAAETVKTIPAFVLGPPGRNDGQAIRELANQPEQWEKVRRYAGNLLYADHVLHRQNPDDAALTELLGKFREMNLPLQLEVGAVKPWGKTGAEAFEKQKPMWERFLRCGALIDGIVLDEPFVCCMFHIKDQLEGVDPMEYAATETAEFIALVRRDYCFEESEESTVVAERSGRSCMACPAGTLWQME